MRPHLPGNSNGKILSDPENCRGVGTLTCWLDLPCLRPGHVGDRVEPRSGSVGWLLRTSPGRRPDYRPPPRRSPSQPPTSPSLCSTRRQRGPAFGRCSEPELPRLRLRRRRTQSIERHSRGSTVFTGRLRSPILSYRPTDI